MGNFTIKRFCYTFVYTKSMLAYTYKIVFTFFPIFMLFIPAYTWLRKWEKQSNKTLYDKGQAKTISAMPSGQVKNYKNNIFQAVR